MRPDHMGPAAARPITRLPRFVDRGRSRF